MVRDTSQFIGDVTGLALLGLTEMLMDLLVLTRYYWDTEVYRCSVQGGVPKHPFSIGCLGVVGQTLNTLQVITNFSCTMSVLIKES